MVDTFFYLFVVLLVHSSSAQQEAVCALAPETGSCDNFMVRWHYNVTGNNCIPFIYGGCSGNDNNFGDEESCLLKCATFDDDPCTTPMEQGNCSQTLFRWHFNLGTEQCEKFIYSGCGGNANNFISLDDCQTTCGSRSANNSVLKSANMCEEPKWRGPCTHLWIRWFYENSTGQCARFVYGGCDGNRNNFFTKEKCESQCLPPVEEVDICKLPMSQGPCSASLIRWHFNAETGQCEKFIYGGCEGNANNYETKEACEKKCSIASISPERVNPCEQQPDRGPCTKAMIRWYFDSNDNTCKPFIYGGCGGNENNFDSATKCMKACVAVPVVVSTEVTTSTTEATTSTITTNEHILPKANVCGLPMDQGPCNKQFVRWYYNNQTNNCEKFIYGGCMGNGNNFISKEECQKMCSVTSAANVAPTTNSILEKMINYPSPKGGDVCQLPADQGTCKLTQIRWYYNGNTKSCEKFIYGGCGGNGNNFATKEACDKYCGSGISEPRRIVLTYHVIVPSNEMRKKALAMRLRQQNNLMRTWRYDNGRGCYYDNFWCRLYPASCFRSKLECLEKRSPNDVICLILPEGFHLLNPKKQCSKYFFTCTGGRFGNHTCQEPLKFDVSTRRCRPAHLVSACQV